MPTDEEIGFPPGNRDERELLLSWLTYLRGAVLRNTEGITDDDARWTPDGRLTSLLGIVNHLTRLEWRYVDGEMLGYEVSRSEEEFTPGAELSLDAAISAYRQRADSTGTAVRGFASLSEPSRSGAGIDLRWVLLHLINETARHAGHADAVRELLDGTTGE